MSLRSTLSGVVSQLGADMRIVSQQLFGGNPPSTQALAHLLRPEIGDPPPQVRRVLEPVVASVALGVIAMLLGMAGLGMVAVFFAAGLIYGILALVFGIRLDMDLPVA